MKLNQYKGCFVLHRPAVGSPCLGPRTGPILSLVSPDLYRSGQHLALLGLFGGLAQGPPFLHGFLGALSHSPVSALA